MVTAKIATMKRENNLKRGASSPEGQASGVPDSGRTDDERQRAERQECSRRSGEGRPRASARRGDRQPRRQRGR